MTGGREGGRGKDVRGVKIGGGFGGELERG